MNASTWWLVLNGVVWAAVILSRDEAPGPWRVAAWSAALALAIQYVGVEMLRLWSWPGAVASVLGAPIFLLSAYAAEGALFARWLPRAARAGRWAEAAYVIAFAAANSLVCRVFARAGIQAFHAWNAWGTFLVAIAVHAVLAQVYWRQRMGVRV